jgi:hypothetical protein
MNAKVERLPRPLRSRSKKKPKRSEKGDYILCTLLEGTYLVWNRIKIEFDEMNFIRRKREGDAILVGDV